MTKVTFYAGAKKICSDSSSPYSCSFKPKKGDVGMIALIAIATDTKGQTATSIKGAKVKPAAKKK